MMYTNRWAYGTHSCFSLKTQEKWKKVVGKKTLRIKDKDTFSLKMKIGANHQNPLLIGD